MRTTSTGALLERAAAVADQLRPTAADIDRGDETTSKAYQLIRESGLLELLVPQAAGGHGGSFLDHTRVLEHLATGNAAIALGFTMHNVAIGSLCETAGDTLPPAASRFRDWVFAEVADRQRMFASAVSEPGSGAKLRGIKASYTESADGFVLDGTKAFVSLSGVADHYVVAARKAGGGSADEVSHFVVSATDDGVSFDRFWDGFALGGTETAVMTLSHVQVARSRLFLGVEGMSLFKLVREPHWMTAGYIGAYLGIAEAIRRIVADTVSGDDARRESPVVQAEVGKLCVDVDAARALVHAAARLVDEKRGTAEANSAIHAAKYHVGELAPRLALDAIRLCGSSALHSAHPIQRLLREATFCSVMPAKPADCLSYIGKAALGFNVFDARTFDW